ncbi:MAG: 5-formyltetrahydrofolate cyclo-ligase [Clostridiales bacterium]|nr:5-formyltetrahydrofolate cyclo-ligase [Clostridiales bacterium]
MNIIVKKAELRADIIKLLTAMPEEARRQASDAIIQRVLALPEYKKAQTIYCFVGVGWEVDTRPLLEDALAAGKAVCVPRCEADGRMAAHRIESVDDLQATGLFGLPEPCENCEIVPFEAIDFAVIPCLCADKNGMRLGRGGGYYDRFMSVFPGTSATVCYSAALQKQVPTETHDKQIDCVVTENEIYRAGI